MSGRDTAEATPEMPIDSGIRRYVDILRAAGVETDQSCQGGVGHACPEPMVRFSGNAYEGFRAYAIAMTHGLPVLSVQHAWSVYEGCLHGPQWVMTFRTADPEITSREPPAVCAEGMVPRA